MPGTNSPVIPAKAGIQLLRKKAPDRRTTFCEEGWVPAFAGTIGG